MVWLIEDGVHQVRLLRAPIWCPSGGGGTREAAGTVAENLVKVQQRSTVLGEYSPDSARAEGSAIVDEPGEC